MPAQERETSKTEQQNRTDQTRPDQQRTPIYFKPLPHHGSIPRDQTSNFNITTNSLSFSFAYLLAVHLLTEQQCNVSLLVSRGILRSSSSSLLACDPPESQSSHSHLILSRPSTRPCFAAAFFRRLTPLKRNETTSINIACETTVNLSPKLLVYLHSEPGCGCLHSRKARLLYSTSTVAYDKRRGVVCDLSSGLALPATLHLPRPPSFLDARYFLSPPNLSSNPFFVHE